MNHVFALNSFAQVDPLLIRPPQVHCTFVVNNHEANHSIITLKGSCSYWLHTELHNKIIYYCLLTSCVAGRSLILNFWCICFTIPNLTVMPLLRHRLWKNLFCCCEEYSSPNDIRLIPWDSSICLIHDGILV